MTDGVPSPAVALGRDLDAVDVAGGQARRRVAVAAVGVAQALADLVHAVLTATARTV